ncbi:hypothetical protein IFR35_23460 [Pseudomonas fluorescens]|uniref:hypothetical protein n=1 Tax=Pseudomonas fluorescens TaxID=294 RepID=UPI001781BB68|nr:hypothetical protein [Pseudomonas fluorescens]MBD8194357.1 hypothetical protein [Pseudomonas fluorescens]MBD8229208.1 hypothetical protein [Pseudomonas fluorescens]MBD8787167.1 hypothetical protein [Pseudomonas fluorescens]MBD8819519.1 hypothetical protein [Pseudomonas fluorescens]
MTAIKERPILFSAPMVRAILEGRKTVTRRTVKPQPEVRMVDMIGPMLTFKNKRGGHWLYPNAKAQIIADCPYGKPGDRLWVRETCLINDFRDINVPEEERANCEILYRADGVPDWEGDEALIRWRPSIHMPRWASRILLEITDVRVERLQDISRADIRAEGLHCPPELGSDDVSPNYRDWYPAAWRELWESINGAGSWTANPWVWCVSFKRVTP